MRTGQIEFGHKRGGRIEQATLRATEDNLLTYNFSLTPEFRKSGDRTLMECSLLSLREEIL